MISKIAVVLSLVCATANLVAQPVLRINEVVTSNITGLPDEYEVDTSNCPVENCEPWYEALGESNLDGEYPDWIEIYNSGTSAINMTGYGLSDDLNLPFQWVFPSTTIQPGGYLIIFASGKNKQEAYLHTNFKLSREGENISLTSPQGSTVDVIATGAIPIHFSAGRNPGNPTSWVVFSTPTPGTENTTPVFPGFTDEVELSHAAGFYQSPISLTLSAISPTASIFYTTDGSTPTQNSSVFRRIPIEINETTVVRARNYEGDQMSSQIVTATYLIDEEFTMPVFSLSTDPDNLWDDDYGIYTGGPNENTGQRLGNYWNDWERPVHVEFFETDETLAFSVDAGVEIFGWGTRVNPQKSLAIQMRDQYGYPELEYQLFPDMPLNNFKSFVLRAGATDSTSRGTFFRDPFATGTIKDKRIDRQAFRPAIVFINGEYWGIQNIREKLNEDYLASHHNIDKDNVDIISRYWRRTYPIITEGDDVAYLAFENFLINNDLNDPENYGQIKSMLDVDEFLNYTAAQIYFANYDWPGNNNKVWRERTPEGKWRSLMYDLDYGLGYQNNANYDMIAHTTREDGTGWPNPSWTTMIYRELLKSTEFRNALINRLADLMNTAFLPENTLARLDALEMLFEPEMPAHIDRWGNSGNTISSMFNWRNNIETVETFLENRTPNVRQHIQDHFNINGTSDLNLVINPPGSGHVKINSVTVDSSTWSGVYFNGIPVQISALPNPGYVFGNVTGAGGTNQANSSFSLTLTGEQTVSVNFVAEEEAQNALVINEINYHSSDANDPGEWVELYNGFGVPIDVSYWVFQDAEFGHNFEIPDGTILEPGQYLVLCSDLTAFKALFPAVSNAVGNFNFGLGNSGDTLRLLDDQGNLVDEVSYLDIAPWPNSPDGDGPTLSLITTTTDNSLPESWLASTEALGTPGAENIFPAAVPTIRVATEPININGEFVFEITVESGRSYVVQVSESLADSSDWTDHIPFTAQPGETSHTIRDPQSEESPLLFYRVEVR